MVEILVLQSPGILPKRRKHYNKRPVRNRSLESRMAILKDYLDGVHYDVICLRHNTSKGYIDDVVRYHGMDVNRRPRDKKKMI